MKVSVLSMTVLVLLSCFAVGYAWLLIDNHDGQRDLAIENSVASAAKEISNYIERRRDALAIYANVNAATLEALESTESGDAEFQRIDADMQHQLKVVVPDYYAFVIRDQVGHYVPDEFDEQIGELCRNDMAGFVRANRAPVDAGTVRQSQYLPYKPVIHPGTQRYHFDMVIPWQGAGGVVHFLSLLFRTDFLAMILRQQQPEGGQLMMLNRKIPDLIEVTADGDRSSLAEKIRLTEREMSLIRYRRAIPDTGWDIVWLEDAGEREAWRDRVWTAAGIGIVLLWLAFAVLALLQRPVSR